MNSIERLRIERENEIICLPDLTHLNDETTRDYTADNLEYIRKQQQKGTSIQQTLIPKEEVMPKKKKRRSYPQDWSNYNLYQTREKAMCYRLLNDAVNSLGELEIQNKGRPTVNINEILKCICVKIYNGCSARRVHSELILFRGLGYMNNTYHFNTICKYLSDNRITPLLYQLVLKLAEPLKEVECFFSTDSSGFSTFGKERWSKIRLKFENHKDYKKLHLTCGARTHIITAVRVTDGTDNDSPYFKPLLEDTAKNFIIREISADAGYLSRENCDCAVRLGAKPYIMPKKNSKGTAKGSMAWSRMIRLWKENEVKFLAHYHRRSNVESTFSMMKRKFGDCLRGKMDTTKENEIMCRIVCHNLSVLSEAMLQLGVKPDF